MGLYTLLVKVLNMSITASMVILVVLLARLLLRKAPKIFSYVLWGIVLFRLLCPVSVTSSLSMLRYFGTSAAQGDQIAYIPANIVDMGWQQASLTFDENGEVPSEAGTQQIDAQLSDKSANWYIAAAYVWLLGITCMLFGSGISLFRVRRKVVGAIHVRDNVYQADYVDSPFVMGVLRPKIYLPSSLAEQEYPYILLHEKTHIRRGDHIVKLFAFLALTIHWFNPLVWLAFSLAEKDMEMSCDEAVMKKMGSDIRVAYSASLLGLATGKSIIAGAPLAFGEGDTEGRIKNVMRYRKPAVFVVVVAVAVVIGLVFALGSNPKSNASELKTDLADVSAFVEMWAKAFCDRDGEAIVAMSSDSALASQEDSGLLEIGENFVSFGFSSPWPWGYDPWGDIASANYRIVNLTESTADILYYAWTSDPHVAVWREHISFHMDGAQGKVDATQMKYLDEICTKEEFDLAYPDGITNTRMDYLVNGNGQYLNNNAKNDRYSDWYQQYFKPETSASALLNLLNNPGKVELSVGNISGDGSVVVTIHFVEDNNVVRVKMVQPYGEDGIWIPQTDSGLEAED